jgi:hypothetical protein
MMQLMVKHRINRKKAQFKQVQKSNQVFANKVFSKIKIKGGIDEQKKICKSWNK